MKSNLMQIVQVAYDIWKTNIKIDDYKKARGYVIQMSHNLNHALDGMSTDLKEMIEPMQEDEDGNSSLLLDPNSLKDDLAEEQKDIYQSLIGCHNFFKYLRNRFASFTLDVPGKENKDKKSKLSAETKYKLSHKVMIDEFNKQVLFKKHITWVADEDDSKSDEDDSKSYDMELIPRSPFGDVTYEVYYDILYMFLENYIRNVVEHNTIISNDEPIRCYLEIKRVTHHRKKLSISIWEYSIKNILPKEFLKKHKGLEDNIKERVDSRPFHIDLIGTSAMVCLANSLHERGSEIEVNPVFVVPGRGDTSTRHKVKYDENKNYYYEDNNQKKGLVPCKSTNGDEGYRLSMEYQFKMDI